MHIHECTCLGLEPQRQCLLLGGDQRGGGPVRQEGRVGRRVRPVGLCCVRWVPCCVIIHSFAVYESVLLRAGRAVLVRVGGIGRPRRVDHSNASYHRPSTPTACAIPILMEQRHTQHGTDIQTQPCTHIIHTHQHTHRIFI